MSSTLKYYDHVLEEIASQTGTGDLNLGGAVSGFQSFACVGDGNSCAFASQQVDVNGNPNGPREVAIGTYTASGTKLSRDTILSSSNSNNAVNWSSAKLRVSLVVPASETPSLDPALGGILRGAKFIRAFGSNLAIGDTDLYTVPTGKRALVVGSSSGYNGSGGTVAWYPQVKISGTYYRLATTISTTNGSTASLFSPIVILIAGDILAVNCATTAGINLHFAVIEFDDTSPLNQGRLVGTSSGDNTLYTCPAGKSAGVLQPMFGNQLGNGGTPLVFIADAGGARNFYIHNVANGGSPGTTNRILATINVPASQRQNSITGPAWTFGSGDFLNINIDVGNAAQFVQLMVVER